MIFKTYYERNVHRLISAEEGFVKVPCFHKIKIVQTLFKKEWIFVALHPVPIRDQKFKHWV